MKSLAVLGSTGSIGRAALSVVESRPDRFRVVALAAGHNLDLLGEQMLRLHRLAHRVVWVNPHRGKEGYLPVQQGIVAALPFVDDFVAGHSMATFEELIEVVAHA